ncbi:MAG: class D beta-lactamase [Brevinemataceae bacterium]
MRFLIFLLLFSNLHALSPQNIPWEETKFIKKIFDTHNISGTFVLFDSFQNKFIGINKKRAFQTFIPGSTFKFPNSIIALNEKVIQDKNQTFYSWDGSDVFLEEWKKDMNLEQAFKTSNVPAYQKIAFLVGNKKMISNLILMDYGNKKIGTNIQRFWLDGPLRISAVEQAVFLNNLAKKELPYDSEILTQVHSISLIEKTKHWEMHGKTGWTTSEKPSIGWFVGWIKKDSKIYSFALNMDLEDSSQLFLRTQAVKEILTALKVID